MPRREISEKKLLRRVNKSEILLHGMKLDGLRKKIDVTDKNILNLLQNRFEIVEEVRKLKQTRRLPVEDIKREKEVLNIHLRMGKKLDLSKSFVTQLFKLIISESKRIQK